jgi:hypothetical protein
MGRSHRQLPPIEVLEQRPPGVSVNAVAFSDRSKGTIYLLASGPAFQTAQSAQSHRAHRGRCLELEALKTIAGIIAHEEWHLRHGPDERGAYHAQLLEMVRLGAGPGTWAYYSTTRSMLAVLKKPKRTEVFLLAPTTSTSPERRNED